MISHNINMMHNPWIMNIELYWFSFSLHTLCIRCIYVWYLKHITRCHIRLHWRVCPRVMIGGRMNALIYSYSVSTSQDDEVLRPPDPQGCLLALWLADIRQLWLLIGQAKGALWQQLKWDDGTPSCRNSLSHNIFTVTANQNQGLEELTNQSRCLHPQSKVIDWRAQTWARVSPGKSHDLHRQAWRVFIQSEYSEILLQSKWKILPEAVLNVKWLCTFDGLFVTQ